MTAYDFVFLQVRCDEGEAGGRGPNTPQTLQTLGIAAAVSSHHVMLITTAATVNASQHYLKPAAPHKV